VRFPLDRLHAFVVAALEALGVASEHAEVTSARLLEADLRGRTGHGLIRVPQYARRIEAGGINLKPDIVLRRTTPVSAVVDGDNGLGQVVMTVAAETALDKAAESGMAWVGTVRSNHAGAAGVYTEMALRREMIGIYMAVASANVMPPWGGARRLLGTNPVSIAIPAGARPAFHLDIATTVASHGTIKVLAQAGERMPEGWVMDEKGRPITDPKEADSGFLVPIGGYKGSGLNIAIGLLAGVLNEAAFGSNVIDHRAVPDRPANTGQALFVMRPDLFRDLDDFKADVDDRLSELEASGPADLVHIPGARASRMEHDRRENGIPVPDELLGQLRSLASSLSLDDRLT